MGDPRGDVDYDRRGSEQVLSLSLNILHYIGMWPWNESHVLYSLYSFLMYCSIPAYLLMMTSYFVSGEDVLASAQYDAAISVVGTLPIFFSLLMLLLKRDEYRELVSSLKSIISRTMFPDTEGPLENVVAVEKKLSLTIMAAFASSVLCLVSKSFVHFYNGQQDRNSSSVMNLPLNMYPIWGEDDNTVFASMFVFQTIDLFAVSSMAAAVEGFIFTLILYTSHQFEMLAVLIRDVDTSIKYADVNRNNMFDSSHRVSAKKDLFARYDNEAEPTLEESGIRNVGPGIRKDRARYLEDKKKRINVWRELASYHQEVFRNGRNLCELLRNIFFLHYITASLEIALLLYGINVTEDTSRKVTLYSYLVAIMIRLFIICHFATKVTSKSIEVGDAICTTNWYDYSQEDKQLLLIMICRNQRRVELWAGKFAVMSLETYIAILQAAYSYYNIMDALR